MGMKYKLKAGAPPFRPVRGKFAGVLFAVGELYDSVPKEHEHWFEAVDETPAVLPISDTPQPALATEEATPVPESTRLRRRRPAGGE